MLLHGTRDRYKITKHVLHDTSRCGRRHNFKHFEIVQVQVVVIVTCNLHSVYSFKPLLLLHSYMYVL